MARAVIKPGACGLTTTVRVTKAQGRRYKVSVSSECEMVEKLGSELGELEMTDAFKRILDNPVYKNASACLRHVSCPVPCGVLKALEVEAGLAVPKEVSIKFEEEDGEGAA
ncbi:MAG: hypothetical protein Kow0025_20800 [Thermodesulfovibrionales bacterium]